MGAAEEERGAEAQNGIIEEHQEPGRRPQVGGVGKKARPSQGAFVLTSGRPWMKADEMREEGPRDALSNKRGSAAE